MTRTLVSMMLMSAALVGPVLAADDPAFTKLRHGHTIRMLCEADRPIEITLHAVKASIGYTDDCSYEVIGPNGQTLARGVVIAGSTRTFALTSPVSGCCLLAADPLMNAFGVEIEGAQWAVDITDDHCIEVIDQARPLRFWVPEGLRTLTLGLSGEAATVQVCGPDGGVLETVEVPQYEPVTAMVDVPAGAAGAFWALELDLAEDLSITFPKSVPGVIADYPMSVEVFRRLVGMGAMSTFDRRPSTPAVMARADLPAACARIEAGDLQLDIASDGSIVGVRRGFRDLTPREAHPFGGFLARDVGAGGGFVQLRGTVEEVGGAVAIAGEFPGMEVELTADLTSARDAVLVDGEIRDLTGADRAISLYFVLPIDADAWYWHDDANNARRILGDGLHSNDMGCRAGACGMHSVYPFACVSGRSAIGMGVNPQQPRIFRLGYEAGTKQLFCALDMGLCRDVRSLPSRAGFSLAVYPTDPAWGFRSAADRYYGIYPKTFEKRMKREGGWVCWGTLESVPDIDKTGMAYHWGLSTADKGKAARHDDQVGAYSIIYNDSVRFFMDLGSFEKRPRASEANQRFRGFVEAEDPLALVLDAPDKATGRSRWLSLREWVGEDGLEGHARRCQEAVRRSYCVNAEGEMIPGYIINREDWGPENWWTGRLHCNPDPEIRDGYGQFLLRERIGLPWRYMESHGAKPDGIGLDNYFVNADDLNYRRAHFQYADIPLTFDRAGRVAICGAFQLLEWVAWLKDWLVARDCYLIPNGPRLGWPFFAHYMDMFGLEWNYQHEEARFYHRTLAHHRPVVTLPLKPEHYTEEWVRMHLGAGMMPGGYGGSKSLTDEGSEYRAILSKYVPVLQAMGRAGWEPVTYAKSDSPAIGVERFGDGTGGTVYYSVRNRIAEPVAGNVEIDLGRIAVDGGPVEIVDGVTGERLAGADRSSVAAIPVRLAGGDVLVMAVRAREVGAGH